MDQHGAGACRVGQATYGPRAARPYSLDFSWPTAAAPTAAMPSKLPGIRCSGAHAVGPCHLPGGGLLRPQSQQPDVALWTSSGTQWQQPHAQQQQGAHFMRPKVVRYGQARPAQPSQQLSSSSVAGPSPLPVQAMAQGVAGTLVFVPQHLLMHVQHQQPLQLQQLRDGRLVVMPAPVLLQLQLQQSVLRMAGADLHG